MSHLPLQPTGRRNVSWIRQVQSLRIIISPLVYSSRARDDFYVYKYSKSAACQCLIENIITKYSKYPLKSKALHGIYIAPQNQRGVGLFAPVHQRR